MGVAVWKSCGVRELHCGRVSACGGHGGCQSPSHCIFGVFYLFRVLLVLRKKENNSLKLTAAKLFASAHFARYMEKARVPVLNRCCLCSILFVS